MPKETIPRRTHKLNIERFPKNHELRKACYLCGLKFNGSPADAEHVLAKVLVQPMTLENPLVLSAHHKCNEIKARDEEYASPKLQASGKSQYGHRSFDYAMEKVKKKINAILGPDGQPINKPGVKLTRNFIESIKEVEAQSPSGIKLGTRRVYPVDTERYRSFFTNIAKGFQVASTAKIYDWEKFEIKYMYTMDQLSDSKTDDFYTSFINQTQFLEVWGDVFLIAGYSGFRDGKVFGQWSLYIFNEHKAIVSFVER